MLSCDGGSGDDCGGGSSGGGGCSGCDCLFIVVDILFYCNGYIILLYCLYYFIMLKAKIKPSMLDVL